MPISETGFIYWVQMDRLRLVKIGFAANVQARLQNLKTASPFDMCAIDQAPGTKAEERFIQKLLRPHRYKREWFRMDGPVWEFLEEFEQYRRDTFEREGFDPQTHKAREDIYEALDAIPMRGFLEKEYGYA